LLETVIALGSWRFFRRKYAARFERTASNSSATVRMTWAFELSYELEISKHCAYRAEISSDELRTMHILGAKGPAHLAWAVGNWQAVDCARLPGGNALAWKIISVRPRIGTLLVIA
jgi:hypothetical protein